MTAIYCALLLASLTLWTRCDALPDSGLFVFGDSLLDVGSNSYIPISLVKATFPPYGIDYPGGKPTGRFGNGKIYTDFFGKKCSQVKGIFDERQCIYVILSHHSQTLRLNYVLCYLCLAYWYILHCRYAAEYLGMASPPPFLSFSSQRSQGVNFASAGAGVMNDTNNYFVRKITSI